MAPVDAKSESPSRSGKQARIYIDGQSHQSPNPTENNTLYRLGEIPPQCSLFREMRGDHEDPEIPRNQSPIVLQTDDRFYSAESANELVVIVNGQKKLAPSRKLTFLQVVALAFSPLPTGPNWVFTITYRNGPPSNPQGTLIEGQSVRVKKGMIFNVTATDKS